MMQARDRSNTRGATVLVCSLLSALVGLAACRPQPVPKLASLGAKIDETSVSGISSGAYMAGQFQLAHGELVSGAAIIAGGPYGCAESLFADLMPGPGTAFLNLTKAINGCMLNAMALWGVPNPPMLAEKAQRLASEGRIAPLPLTASDRVYLFTGREDHTVVPPIVQAAAAFYAAIGVPADRIRLVANLAAGHAFVTETEGLSCDATGKPYIVDCDYDQAGDLLTFIYGPLVPRAERATGRYALFDQTPFTDGLPQHGMADEGVVYIPRTCEGGGEPANTPGGAPTGSTGCRVHIAFHGCAQNRMLIGDAFIEKT
ncbi:MAG: hypothetical protein AB7L18_15060, partial [Hyphomicrobiaceae bacterium]